MVVSVHRWLHHLDVRVLDVSTMKSRCIVQRRPGDRFRPRVQWSNDSSMLALATNDGTVCVVKAASGRRRIAIVSDAQLGSGILNMSWSADDCHLMWHADIWNQPLYADQAVCAHNAYTCSLRQYWAPRLKELQPRHSPECRAHVHENSGPDVSANYANFHGVRLISLA